MLTFDLFVAPALAGQLRQASFHPSVYLSIRPSINIYPGCLVSPTPLTVLYGLFWNCVCVFFIYCIIWEYASAFDEIPILISFTWNKHYVFRGGEGMGGGVEQVQHQLHEVQSMGKMLRIHILDIFSKDYDPIELKLDEEHQVLSWLKIQDNSHSHHLENQFLVSLPKPWSISVKTCSVAAGPLLDRNELKSCQLVIQKWSYWQFVRMVLCHSAIWPPCPYLVKKT